VERDRINHPDHYTQGDIECIQAIEAALGKAGALAYCRGCAIKYLWRCMYKKSPKKDLQKAAWYCNRAQEYIGVDKTPTSVSEPKFVETELTNQDRWLVAKSAGSSHWIDTANRVRSTMNPPEGDE